MANITRSPINGQIEADDIKSPNHYTWRGRECEEIIGEITQGAEGKEAYYLGAVVKYLYRYPKKGTPLKDLQKAKQYIEMLIELKGGVVMNEAAVILANISAELSKAREAVYRDNEMDMDCKDRALSAIDAAFRELDRAYSYLEE